MTQTFEGLQHKDELDEFVRDVARVVCKSYGLNPDSMKDMPAGHDDDGNPIVEQVPQWEPFVQDVQLTLEYVFGLSTLRVRQVQRRWNEYTEAQERITRMMEESDEGE